MWSATAFERRPTCASACSTIARTARRFSTSSTCPRSETFLASWCENSTTGAKKKTSDLQSLFLLVLFFFLFFSSIMARVVCGDDQTQPFAARKRLGQGGTCTKIKNQSSGPVFFVLFFFPGTVLKVMMKLNLQSLRHSSSKPGAIKKNQKNSWSPVCLFFSVSRQRHHDEPFNYTASIIGVPFCFSSVYFSQSLSLLTLFS